MSKATALTDYRLLGRSGLRISPLALGGMTFGDDFGWGAAASEVERIIDLYIDRGGNFIDTANFYTSGTSERLIGAALRGRRDRIVLATKFTMSMDPSNPNASGNHRLNMTRSVEASLKRLGTDVIDLLYVHAWDATTPVEEVLRGLDDLVRSGKVVYIGISDAPAWQVSRMQAIADLRGWSPLVALQVEYSLVERTVERELIPMAAEMGLGVLPWSPLGGGVLTGKYGSGATTVKAETTRREVVEGMGGLTTGKLTIAAEVVSVAEELGCTPAQVAIAWTLLNPTVAAPVLGVRTGEQLEDNLGALDVVLDGEARRRLDVASAVDMGFPHTFFETPLVRSVMFGETPVSRRP